MRPRKEGLERLAPRIEISCWYNDSSGDRPEYGFGVTGFTWKYSRRRWWKDGYWRIFRQPPGTPPQFDHDRPRWKKEIAGCWKMLDLEITMWHKIVNISIRLWKVPWTEPTKFS